MYMPDLPGVESKPYIFTATGGQSAVAQWQSWAVPIGAKWLFGTVIGAGGRGGAGHAAAAASARGGGGGGGAGAITTFEAPAFRLPSVLWFSVSPGSKASLGLNAAASYISFEPTTAAVNAFMLAQPGGNGGNGTAAAVGAAGSAGTVMTSANCMWSSLANWTARAGQTGSAGGAIVGAAGAAVTWGAGGVYTCGGTGSGGTTSADFAGGAITAAGLFRSGVAGGLAGTNAGNDGQFVFDAPPRGIGGTGGGSSNTGTGGAGGRGGYGCGGGAGGAGVTAGASGDGGSALIMIWVGF
jgi:hypothetical protein